MSNLKMYSDEELVKELERREVAKKLPNAPIPMESEEMNIEMLRDLCIEVIQNIDQLGYYEEDYKQYIFEQAMVSVYGKNIFEYINKKMK